MIWSEVMKKIYEAVYATSFLFSISIQPAWLTVVCANSCLVLSQSVWYPLILQPPLILMCDGNYVNVWASVCVPHRFTSHLHIFWFPQFSSCWRSVFSCVPPFVQALFVWLTWKIFHFGLFLQTPVTLQKAYCLASQLSSKTITLPSLRFLYICSWSSFFLACPSSENPEAFWNRFFSSQAWENNNLIISLRFVRL